MEASNHARRGRRREHLDGSCGRDHESTRFRRVSRSSSVRFRSSSSAACASMVSWYCLMRMSDRMRVEQLVAVERLRDEVVGTGGDRRGLLGALARREHDHGKHRRRLLLAELPADGEAVGWGHHHVEQHEVRLGGDGQLERSEPVRGRDDVVALTLEHGLQEAHVLRHVVDDEDPPGAAVHRLPPSQWRLTASRRSAMFTGFER